MPTSPNSLAVVHVALSLDLGGLEHVILNLVREGQGLGQRVSVICLERAGILAAEVEKLGGRVYSAGKPYGLHPSTIPVIRDILHSIAPDVIHSHNIGALMYTGAAARRLSPRPAIVHTEHNNHFRKTLASYKRVTRSLLVFAAARYVSRFFCVSSDVADSILALKLVPRRKVCVIPNGIDLSRFSDSDAAQRAALRASLGIPSGAPLIGTIGRLNEVKRQDLLIEAFAALAQRFPDSHLLIVGDGPMTESLRAQARGLNLDSRVHFAGYQSHPEQYLALLDVFALTSRIEGMPLVVLEAAAMRVPVIASRVGGLHEVSDDGRAILLYDFGDQPALIAGLERLLTDKPFARQLAAAARLRAETIYSTTRMASDYERHYREVLAGARPPRGRIATLPPD